MAATPPLTACTPSPSSPGSGETCGVSLITKHAADRSFPGLSHDALSLWGAGDNPKWASTCPQYLLPSFLDADLPNPSLLSCPLPALLSGRLVPPGGTGTESSDSQLSSLSGKAALRVRFHI